MSLLARVQTFSVYSQHRHNSIRESVDSLYRDDTGEISRDPRTKRLKTR